MGDQTFGLAINTVKTLMSQNGCKTLRKLCSKEAKMNKENKSKGIKYRKGGQEAAEFASNMDKFTQILQFGTCLNLTFN